jgi:hypothetical protein
MKTKSEYLKLVKTCIKNKDSRSVLSKQIDTYFDILNSYKPKKHSYKVWDLVKLKKWTLLHWTWKNIDWLEFISKSWLLTWQFEWWREWKYFYTVWVWNLKDDILLKDYINFYSWWTVKCFHWWRDWKEWYSEVKIIPYDEFKNFLKLTKKEWVNTWYMEQTKEARFMPSLAQDFVQIWIIMNWTNKYAKLLKEGDILDLKFSEKTAKEFVHPEVYESHFLSKRKCKDAFYTDRESAILFWIPSVLIEWILVWRKYEKNKKILKKIKELLPNVYICNLDWKVISN